jgi:group I intron endonuclease
MKISGIYKIGSKVHPDRIYVGSAVSIHYRILSHLSMLRKNKHHNPKLQSHFNKHGESDLVFTVLLGCEKDDLLKHEQFFIDSLNPSFNVCRIAGSPKGHIPSEKTRKLWSEQRKGKPSWNKGIKTGPQSLSACEKKSNALKGRPSPMKGKHFSEEAKMKSSESHKGHTTWNKGKKTPEETLKKRRGRPAWNKGLPKELQPNFGNKNTKETIEKRIETYKKNKQKTT